MTFLRGMGCCGAFELVGISFHNTPEEMFVSSMYEINRVRIDFPFVIFTGVTKVAVGDGESAQHIGDNPRLDNYGQTFANFIKKHGLGLVTTTESRKNWSNNEIQLWVWHIDRTRSKALFNKLTQRN